MNNTINTIKNSPLNINFALYADMLQDISHMCLDDETKFMANIDMEEINKAIAYSEAQEDNPDMWIPFDEAKKDIRRTILSVWIGKLILL